QLAMVERQCQGWPAFYLAQGPFGLSIWSDTEPIKGTVISYTVGAWEDRAPLTIWMDGRPHPSGYAEHTRAGFTTGTWDGNTLVTTYEGGTAGTVPHYLPEKNPFVEEMTKKYQVPRDAVLGFPETLYPEYRKKLKAVAPAK